MLPRFQKANSRGRHSLSFEIAVIHTLGRDSHIRCGGWTLPPPRCCNLARPLWYAESERFAVQGVCLCLSGNRTGFEGDLVLEFCRHTSCQRQCDVQHQPVIAEDPSASMRRYHPVAETKTRTLSRTFKEDCDFRFRVRPSPQRQVL